MECEHWWTGLGTLLLDWLKDLIPNSDIDTTLNVGGVLCGCEYNMTLGRCEFAAKARLLATHLPGLL